MGSGTEADWARETRLWKEAGCSPRDSDKNVNRSHQSRSPAARWATT